MGISKYTQPTQIQPLDVFDDAAFEKAVTIKQMRYDQGLQKAQQLLDSTSRVDIMNPHQQAYLDKQVDSLLKNANSGTGIDFSDKTEIAGLNNKIGAVTNDPVVRNAIASTQNARKFQKNTEALYNNPKYEDYRFHQGRIQDQEKFNEYLNSTDLSASWSQRTPQLNSGFDKDIYQMTSEMPVIEETELLGNGEFLRTNEFRTKNMMFSEASRKAYSNPDYMRQMRTEFEVEYKDETSRRALYEQGHNMVSDRLKLELDDALALEVTGSMKEKVADLKERIGVHTQLKYSEDAALKMFADQRIIGAMAPEILNKGKMILNQGFYMQQRIDMTAAMHVDSMRDKAQANAIRMAQLEYDLTGNYTGSLVAGMGKTREEQITMKNSNFAVPDQGENMVSFRKRRIEKQNSASSILKTGILAISAKANPGYFDRILGSGIIEQLENPEAGLGPSVVNALDQARGKLIAKEKAGEVMNQFDKDLSFVLHKFAGENATAKAMQLEEEQIIGASTEQFLKNNGQPYTVEDYLEYHLAKENEAWHEGWFKDGIGEHMDQIEREIDKGFAESNHNFFEVSSNYFQFDKEPNDFIHNMLVGEIQAKGVYNDKAEHFDIGDHVKHEDATLLESVDPSKIDFMNGVQIFPSIDTIEVNIPHKIGTSSKNEKYRIKLSPDKMARVTEAYYGQGKGYNSTYTGNGSSLTRYVKRNGMIHGTGNAGNAEFSLYAITGFPIANRVTYTYQSGEINVNITGFGNLVMHNLDTIEDAEARMKEVFSLAYANIKKKNPDFTEDQIVKNLLPALQEHNSYLGKNAR